MLDHLCSCFICLLDRVYNILKRVCSKRQDLVLEGKDQLTAPTTAGLLVGMRDACALGRERVDDRRNELLTVISDEQHLCVGS